MIRYIDDPINIDIMVNNFGNWEEYERFPPSFLLAPQSLARDGMECLQTTRAGR